MPVFEVESWLVAEGKQEKHDDAIRRWFKWVNDHRELFKEWKSVRYFVKNRGWGRIQSALHHVGIR